MENKLGTDTDTASSRPTVLLVDDEPNILSALRRLLRNEPLDVLTAESGMAAAELLAARPVDLIISDMRMPGMSGAELLSLARVQQPEAIRVLLTGYADVQSTIQAINEGQIYRYLNKPWDDTEVLLLVRSALEVGRLRRETERLQVLTQQQNAELKALNADLEQKVEKRTEQLRKVLGAAEDANLKLRKSYVTTLKVFSNLMELREGNMAGHSRRVADIARKIAKQMGLPEQDVADIYMAGLLHDIGKIGLPDELLGKPFNLLTFEERTRVVAHAANGQMALMALEHLAKAGVYIRGHHERYDGLGFPDNLSGEGIPLGARILAVANEFDGLQHGRQQPEILSADDALLAIRQGSEKKFDRRVVEALVHLHDEQGHELAPNEEVLRPALLTPGMVLTRDLVSREGVLLLAHEHVLDRRAIDHIARFEDSEGWPLLVHVAKAT